MLDYRSGRFGATKQGTGDEFVGTFANWINVKTEFGATGDGKTDDTIALQRSLDALRPEDSKRKVLFLPVGTYRVTATRNVLREKHNESTGISILGEDPATTLIQWDGPAEGVMLYYAPWDARMGRLTLDGARGQRRHLPWKTLCHRIGI